MERPPLECGKVWSSPALTCPCHGMAHYGMQSQVLACDGMPLHVLAFHVMLWPYKLAAYHGQTCSCHARPRWAAFHVMRWHGLAGHLAIHASHDSLAGHDSTCFKKRRQAASYGRITSQRNSSEPCS